MAAACLSSIVFMCSESGASSFASLLLSLMILDKPLLMGAFCCRIFDRSGAAARDARWQTPVFRILTPYLRAGGYTSTTLPKQ